MSRFPIAGFGALLVMLAAGSASAADKAGCKDPAWSPQRPVGYDIESCDVHAWTKRDFDTRSGSVTVYGRLTEVNYQLRDGAKDHTNDDVRNFYAAAAMKAGATAMTDPKSGFGVKLAKKSPQGDVWFAYDHGSGNDTSTGSYTITTFEVMPLKQEVQAQAWDGTGLNVKGKPCANPPWLKQQFSYFKVDSCEGKAWDSVDVSLANGDRKIEGARLSVDYSLTDEKRSPSAIAVQKNFIAALQAIGAKLMSKPDDSNTAVLMQKTPKAEIWYLYSHGSGNDEATSSYTLTTVVVTSFAQEVQAQLITAPLASTGTTCANPTWLKKQFDYFKLAGCGYMDINSITLDLPAGKKTLVGRYMTANYTLTDQTRDPTALTVKKNYVNALQAIGAKLVSDPNDGYSAVLTQTTPQGAMWYIYKHGSGNENSTTAYDLVTVEVGGPAPKTCTLEVYGVNFDFNKSILRPESEPVLQQVLALFTADPSYSAEIGGHTDNVGKEAYNMTLSGQRADAVKAWLVAHGVAASRLTTHGYGDTKPLVPNTTDDNRFKNRRVELKRNACK